MTGKRELFTDLGPVKAPSDEERAAALTICERATDVEDARELLTMVGLL